MADEVQNEEQVEQAGVEPAKKKMGKLPIIAVILFVLLAGGFFVLKKRHAAPAEPSAPQLGAIVPVQEMLVNLSGGQYYLKTEISLHMAKGFKKEDLDANKEAVEDAILLLLKSKKLQDIQTTEQLKQLKIEIASAVNAILNRDQSDADGSSDGDASDGGPNGADAKSSKDAKASEDGSEDSDVKIPADYDSKSGPVLKVYFTSFATQ